MDFEQALSAYNRKITSAIAEKKASIRLINDLYESLEYIFAKEIVAALKKIGVVQSINAKQEYLADHWESIHDHSFDPSMKYIVVTFNNGEVVKAKVGSLKSITVNTVNISETHPLFLLAMGYLSINAFETVCLARVCEAHLDQEI